MKKKLYIILFFIFINIQIPLSAKIINLIVAKVDDKVITAFDLENEIKSFLILNNLEAKIENIKKSQNIAMNALVRKTIKKQEVEKYKVTNFSEEELNNSILNLAKKRGVSLDELKNIFSKNNVDFNIVIEDIKTQLLWNTLIFELYSKKLNLNTIEIENELEKEISNKRIDKSYNISEIEIQDKKSLSIVLDFIKKNNFKTAVKKFSVSESAIMDGKLGWIKDSELSNLYSNSLKEITVGEITSPIPNLNGYVILKLNNIKIIDNKKIDENDKEEIKKLIIFNKKNDKLNLYSRSHFSKLENSSLIIIK